jgi:pyrimidine operon attenuation protein/uracil phosphoribosyltransferase
MPQIQLLDSSKAQQIIKRMAYEIYENNIDEKEITLIGIQERGVDIAHLLQNEIELISKLKIISSSILIDKSSPLNPVIIDKIKIANKNIIIVDDVANSGKTILYALKCLLHEIPNKIQIAVLIDRKHKLFPISSDFIGMQISTTMKENIKVIVEKGEIVAAILE